MAMRSSKIASTEACGYTRVTRPGGGDVSPTTHTGSAAARIPRPAQRHRCTTHPSDWSGVTMHTTVALNRHEEGDNRHPALHTPSLPRYHHTQHHTLFHPNTRHEDTFAFHSSKTTSRGRLLDMYSVQSSTERALHGRQADAHTQLVLVTHGAAGAHALKGGLGIVQADTAREDDHIRPDGRSRKKSATLPERQSTWTVLLAPGLRDPCSLYTVRLV